MRRSHAIMDIFVHPGELYFGEEDTRLRTILGSCVAITMWHPKRKIGGMSHCLLPGADRQATAEQLDGKYVEDAVAWLVLEAARHCTRLKDYEFKLFGGSDMFGKVKSGKSETIGSQNVARALRIFDALDLSILAHDIGGTVSRSLIFELATGDAWIRRGMKRQALPKPLELQA